MMYATVSKKNQQKILSLFKGNKTRKSIKNAATIASLIGVPKRHVMMFLEDEGLRMYSSGSYL
jgi:hypothetical protein